MNYRNPYAPDYNPPPGIPKEYPYGPNTAVPSSNPMYPSLSPGYPPVNPYGSASSVGSQAPYPGVTSSGYPASSPYPAGVSSPYSQSGMTSYPGNSSSPYPAGGSPYPSTGSSPYSAIGSSPYPPSGSSPYPPSGSSPYPPSGSSPYPPSGSSPYTSSGSSPYASVGISPYPRNDSSPYPSQGTSPYPGNGSPYPSHGASPYPSSSPYPISVSHQKFQGLHSQNMAQYAGEATIKPYPNFDPKVDAEVLRKAMKGFGTDEKAIINILANRSNSQRVYIGVAFKQLFGKDLIDDLKSELSGNFETTIIALMTPMNDYLAQEVHRAISGLGTDEDVLIEVLCTRTNQELWAINEAYRRLYGKALEDDIKSDTSGHFQRLLISACTGARSEAPADTTKAKQNAHALFSAGVGQWGTDESVFNSILLGESFQQLALTFYEYHKLTGHSVADAIDKEMSGDLKQGMLAIARCVENRPFYFAQKLYKAMKGLGTDDRTLIRIVVTRCEIDMVQIKAEYERSFGKPLVDAIHGDTSGDYRRILIALVNGN